MEIVRSKLELKIDGQAFGLAFPSIKLWREYNDRVIANPGKEVDVTLSFLDKLGLPVDVSETLETAHIRQIVDALSGIKKN